MTQAKKYGIYFAFLGNLGIIIGFWWYTSHGLFGSDLSGILLALGRLTGLLAVYCVLLQFMLMGRAVWIEKVFGLDKLARVHRLNGYFSLGFILLHPLLIIMSYSMAGKINIVDQFLDLILNYEDVLSAEIAVMIFVVIVFLSITMVRKKLKYELWYYIHLFTYLAIFLAFGHQLKQGGDFLGNKYFVYYWWTLYIFVVANMAVFRFLQPIYKSLKYRYRVADIVAETSEATSVYINCKNLRKWKFKPGQFIILTFLAKKFWYEAHPFSLSYLPKNDRIRVTIKNSGDFTARIPTLKKGIPMIIEGPYGTFTPQKNPDAKYLFIAGGVGITPIRALIEQLAPTNDIIVLYSNKTLQDTIFKKELDELSQKHSFPLHYILTEQPDYAGEKGRLDQEKILRLVKDIKEREVYICGPIPMLDGMRKLIQEKEIGVQHNRIHFEKFAL